MRIAVVDDEKIICSEIEKYIMGFLCEIDKRSEISVYYSGKSFCSALKSESFDLVFLDIELGECSGLDVSRFIRGTQGDQTTQIVYVTGKNGYDRLLFDFRPFGFIAKPVNEPKVAEILENYQRIFGRSKTTFRYNLNHTDCWVRLNDVIYFESEDRKVNMYLNSTGEAVTFYMKMSEIYEQVKNDPFLFIHKSFIVNERYIAAFQSDYVRMTNGKELPVSRLRRKDVLLRQMEIEMGGGSNDDR